MPGSDMVSHASFSDISELAAAGVAA